MDYINRLYDLYNNIFTFKFIYISEAHASNEWPIRIKKELNILQHKTKGVEVTTNVHITIKK